jgi:hypothetical protein
MLSGVRSDSVDQDACVDVVLRSVKVQTELVERAGTNFQRQRDVTSKYEHLDHDFIIDLSIANNVGSLWKMYQALSGLGMLRMHGKNAFTACLIAIQASLVIAFVVATLAGVRFPLEFLAYAPP